jgi:hypothetical protein
LKTIQGGARSEDVQVARQSLREAEQAKEDWRAGRFAPVTGETEFIPLPEQGPH